MGARYLYSSRSNQFDIYDAKTNTWSIGVLPFSIEGASIISVNNTIYVAGGMVDMFSLTRFGSLNFKIHQL